MREKRYVDHWNIGDHKKDYDALIDQYTSSYFSNHNVKKHLRKLSKVCYWILKAANKEPQTVDLLRMTQLLTERYHWRPQKSVNKL